MANSRGLRGINIVPVPIQTPGCKPAPGPTQRIHFTPDRALFIAQLVYPRALGMPQRFDEVALARRISANQHRQRRQMKCPFKELLKFRMSKLQDSIARFLSVALHVLCPL